MDHAEQRAQEKRAAVEMMLAGGVTMVRGHLRLVQANDRDAE